MKYNKIFITIALCASFTQQISFGMNQRYEPEGWTGWLTRQAQTAKSYASSAMSGLSSRMTNIYNKVSNWSTTTKASVFLATAGALIALGYDKETLKKALDAGISGTGKVLNTGLKIIQENPKTAATVGLGGMGLYGIAQLKESSEDSQKLDFMNDTISTIYLTPFWVPISSYAMILNDLDKSNNAEKWAANLKATLGKSKLKGELASVIPEEINIEEIVIQGMTDKLTDLSKGSDLQNTKDYLDDLAALEKLEKQNPVMSEKVKIRLRANDEFMKNSRTKAENTRNLTKTDLTLPDILKLFYNKEI